MLNPTGNKIRNDPMGSGDFNASRGKNRKHNGVDFIAIPGQPILSPISGTVTRRVRAYANESYFGIEIDGEKISIILLYLDPKQGVIGRNIEKGETVGFAQDISQKYGRGMIPHIHFRITRCDPLLLIGMP